MSKIKEILDYQIYPALYQRIETALPEFEFKRVASGYKSSNKLKNDGSTGDKIGGVYIYDDNISHLIDYTRGSVSIWDYIQVRNGLTANYQVLSLLSELSGISLPEGNNEDLEEVKKLNIKSQLWEEANSFFINCLENNPEAQEYKEYLKTRGLEDIKYFGFIPSQDALYEHLKTLGYKEEDYQNISLNRGIGSTHKLTLPWRDPLGRIKGVIVRNIKHKPEDKLSKYLYSTGLDKNSLFNLKAIKGDKDLIIVEGLIDCLIATNKGLNNVVALGGTSLNKEQIETAIKYGAKKVTLCLDNDSAGKDATLKVINVITVSGLPCYVVSLPDGIKDPNEYILKRGYEDFKDRISRADTSQEYLLEDILYPYSGKDLTNKEMYDVVEKTLRLFLTITDPLNKDLFYTTIENITKITKEGYKDKIHELEKERKTKIHEANLKNLLAGAGDLISRGKLTEAQDLLLQGNKEIKIQTAEELIFKPKYSDFISDISNSSTPLKTGINSLDDHFRIPVGAITLIAGRPGHGKTTFMFNLMLSMSKVYSDKKFYFFTLEEEYQNIYIKILNRLIEYPKTNYQRGLLTDPKHPELITNEQIIRQYLKDKREDISLIEGAKTKLKELINSEKIVIMDKPNTIEELSLVINYLHKKENIGAVFIDYIQRLRTKEKTGDKRLEINYISDYILNHIAKETGLPIILGAQFNRDDINSPTLSNLKESGNLEEDTNLVLSVYVKNQEEKITNLEVKALKNRDGQVNKTVTLTWDKGSRKIVEDE